MGGLELVEQLETASTRFLNTNLKEATIRTGRNQTTIRIWLGLEVTTMNLLREMAGEHTRMLKVVTE